MSERSIKSLIAVVALPPPLTGQSYINKRVVAEFAIASDIRIKVCNVGAVAPRRGFKYHFYRIIRVIHSLFVMVITPGLSHVYTVLDSGFGILYNAIVFFLARLLGVRLIVHHHTSSHIQKRTTTVARLIQLAGRDATHVVLSEEMRRDIVLQYPIIQNCFVVHNSLFINQQLHKSDVGNSLPTIRLGHLSNLSLDKGLDTVLNSFRMTREAGYNTILTIAGACSNKHEENMIASAKLEFGELIHYLGPVSGKSKDDFFSTLDIFLFPSRYKHEAQPLVVLEAMSFGCVPLVNDIGYTKELLCDDLISATNDNVFAETCVNLCEMITSGEICILDISVSAKKRFLFLRDQSSLDFEALVDYIKE